MLSEFSSRSLKAGRSARTPCPWGYPATGQEPQVPWGGQPAGEVLEVAVLREVLAAGGSAGREEPGAGSAGQHPASTAGAAPSSSMAGPRHRGSQQHIGLRSAFAGRGAGMPGAWSSV